MIPPAVPFRVLALGVGLSAALVACSSGASSAPAARSTTTRVTTTSTSAAPVKTLHATVTTAAWKLPRPSTREALIANQGDLLVLGGFDGAKRTIAQVLRVDVGTGATTAVGELAEAVHDAAGAPMLGEPLVFGGGNASESSAVQRFGPGPVATVVGRLPIPRSDLGAVTVGTRTYLIGGYDGSSIRATTLATTDGVTFTLLGDLPVPVRYPAVAAVGTSVVILGGITAAGATTAVQVLDTQTGTVRVVGQLPETLSDASATTVRGQIYVFGGRWGGAPTAQVWRWDVATNALVPVGTMAAPVTDGAATTIGDSAYFVGGESPLPTTTVSILTVR